jgi:hypothetical protein
VHFEVWIQAKLLDVDEDAALARGGAQLRAAVVARAPDSADARGNCLGRSARAQHLPEIDPGLSV